MFNRKFIGPVAVVLVGVTLMGISPSRILDYVFFAVVVAGFSWLGWLLWMGRRDKYDLRTLSEVHERAQWQEEEPEEGVEYDGIVCPMCGTNYSPRLPICPRCAGR